MAKCKNCSKKNGVYGIEDAKFTAIAAAVVGAVVTGKVDEMATTNADGTMKDNYFANNPTMKNAAYLAGAIVISAFMPGEMYQGAAMGVASYSGYQLIQEFMKPDPGVTGLAFKPPMKIAGLNGLRRLPGNAGIAPEIIAGIKEQQKKFRASNEARNRVLENAEMYNDAEKMGLEGFDVAL